MGGPFDTQISIGVSDHATPVLRNLRSEARRLRESREALGMRSEQRIQREIDRTTAAYNRQARSATASQNDIARAHERMQTRITTLRRELETLQATREETFRRNKTGDAFDVLGLNSGHSVQREIDKTIAAYNRLERSGTVSASDLARAWEKTTQTVAKLRKELEVTERASRFSLGGAGKVIGGIAGGIAGGAMVLRRPISDAASYDAELRRLANFAYSDRGDVAGRSAGMEDIDGAIKKAVSLSGDSADEAFSGLETMLRSGVVSRSQAFQFLPYVLKNAMATGADAASVANTQASAVNFGLSNKDAPAALSVLTTMAQHGRIDVPELAHHIPRGLEAGKSAGFHDKRGFTELVAFFEASAIGAKDPQDAATNANDFLAELTSHNLQAAGKHVKIGGHGLDIQKMMRADLEKGLSPLDTITHAIDAMDSNDPEYRKYRKALKSARTPEEKSKLEAQINQIHGQHISALFANQQARNAWINFDRNRDYFNKQVNEGMAQFSLPEDKRSADLDFNVVSAGAKWKTDREKHVNDLVSNDAMNPLSKLWGNLMKDLTDLEEKFPALAVAVSGATTAVKGLGAILGGGYAGVAGVGAIGLGIYKYWRGGAAGDAVGDAAEVAGKAGLEGDGLIARGKNALKSGGRMVKRLASRAGTVLEDGLVDTPLELITPWTTALAALLPSNTVSQSEEDAEKQRLGRARQRIPTAEQALAILQGHAGHAPAPVVNVTVHLDGHEILSWFETHVEQASRRYGSGP